MSKFKFTISQVLMLVLNMYLLIRCLKRDGVNTDSLALSLSVVPAMPVVYYVILVSEKRLWVIGFRVPVSYDVFLLF